MAGFLVGAFKKLFNKKSNKEETDGDDDGVPDASDSPDTGVGEPGADTVTESDQGDGASKPIPVIDDIKSKLMTDSTGSASSWEMLPAPIESASRKETDVDVPFIDEDVTDRTDNVVSKMDKKTDDTEEKMISESVETLQSDTVTSSTEVTGVKENITAATGHPENTGAADNKGQPDSVPEKTGTKSGESGKTGTKSGESGKTGTKSGESGKTGTKSGESEKTGTKSGESGKTGTKSGESGKTGTKLGDKAESADEKSSSTTKKEKKICYNFRKYGRCNRRKCTFAHVRDSDQQGKQDKPVVDESSKKKEFLLEKDFPNYLDFVTEMTKQDKQVNAKDVIYKLGYMKDVNSQTLGDALIGQHKLAMSRNHWHWVRDARYFAGVFFPQDWIDDNLPTTYQKTNKNKNNRTKKVKKNNKNDFAEVPSGMCRDVRLKDNPNLETVTSNAADDGSMKVKKDIELGKRTTDLAAGDGKDISPQVTPSKRKKLAKVDVTRTPRSRPDQLALGFNYHSDLVVKQSPRTVNGEIIPIDTLPAPRNRPEQLAVGFNYLAEQLVKDSPKSETGEVIIPGIVKSPIHRVRDQLAVGFNYHADLMVKESPHLLTETSEDNKNLKSKKKNAVNLNNRYDGEKENKENTEIQSPTPEKSCLKTSSKITERDTLAFGFSYNSDPLFNVPLKELGGNIADDQGVSSLIEDAVINEGRNLVEVVDDVPVSGLPDKPVTGIPDIPTSGLPAGSVW